jgi:hypothetical protein
LVEDVDFKRAFYQFISVLYVCIPDRRLPCRDWLGPGSRQQAPEERRYLRHQLVVAAASSHVLSGHSRVALALFDLETFSQSAGIADCGTEKQQAIVALAFFGSRTPARSHPNSEKDWILGERCGERGRLLVKPVELGLG